MGLIEAERGRGVEPATGCRFGCSCGRYEPCGEASCAHKCARGCFYAGDQARPGSCARSSVQGASPRRVSVLQTARLANGELAWPVARARGISEVTFRARLKLLGADLAVSRPIEPRDFSGEWAQQREAWRRLWKIVELNRRYARRLLRRAEKQAAAAGVGLPASERARRSAAIRAAVAGRYGDDETAADYAGVLLETVDERLCAWLNGSGYFFQERQGETWAVIFDHGYLANVVDWLSDRGVWSVAASVLPGFPTKALDALAAGDLPLMFIARGDELCWLVRSDEAGW